MPANPTKAGYNFSGWNTAADGSGSAFTSLTAVTGDITVYAQWEAKTYNRLVYLAGANGTVNDTATVTFTVEQGSTGETVTAAGNGGYHFASWDDSASIPAARRDTATADATYTASFAINTYEIVASSGPNGSVTPAGTKTYDYGTTVTYTIAPASGYSIAQVLVDGSSVGASSTVVFKNISANHTVAATFTTGAHSMPVWRFRKIAVPYIYLWSSDPAEKANIVATLGSKWLLDGDPGIAYNINTANPKNNVPLYRYRNLKNWTYLFTADPAEMAILDSQLTGTWVKEGISYNVSLDKSEGSGLNPVWRFRNLKNGTYFYTADPNEKTNIVNTLQGTFLLEGAAYTLGLMP
jgi:uncharacterized repeat protein (TIGR02543 family)